MIIMRFLIILILLVSSSCQTNYFPKEFRRLKFKVDCDTIQSKFWVKYAAVNVFPKTVFSDVKIFDDDTSITYQIREEKPMIESYTSRLYRKTCFFSVNKKDCRLIQSGFIRH